MTLSEAVMTALIMAAASVICQLLINSSNRRKREIEEAVKDAQLQAKLAGIETRLDEHNNYASKISSIGESLHSITTDIALIKNDLNHLAKKGEAK